MVMIPAPLSPLEMALAKGVGILRHRAVDATNPLGAEGGRRWLASEGAHVNGAAAELVVARLVDRYWNAVTSEYVGSVDVGLGLFGLSGQWDVKWTAHRDGHLIVRREDDRRRVFVLVVGLPPELEIVGALDGAHACSPRYWRADSWWVPQSDLIEWR